MSNDTKRQWKVIAYTGKRGEVRLRDGYVIAESEEQARSYGRSMFRILGQRGNFLVHAIPYDPSQDREMRTAGFIREVPSAR